MTNPPVDPDQALVHLEESERHVHDGKLRVERQRALLAGLRDGGHPTQEAETLLERFHDILAQHITNRNRLREEVDGKIP
jgi:hypothetical protein